MFNIHPFAKYSALITGVGLVGLCIYKASVGEWSESYQAAMNAAAVLGIGAAVHAIPPGGTPAEPPPKQPREM